jgi:hypothetical protein
LQRRGQRAIGYKIGAGDRLAKDAAPAAASPGVCALSLN